jgi:hypothetical protein
MAAYNLGGLLAKSATQCGTKFVCVPGVCLSQLEKIVACPF